MNKANCQMYKTYVPEGCVIMQEDVQNSLCLSNGEVVSELIKRDF